MAQSIRTGHMLIGCASFFFTVVSRGEGEEGARLSDFPHNHPDTQHSYLRRSDWERPLA